MARPVVQLIHWGSASGSGLPFFCKPVSLVVLTEGRDLSFLWSGRSDLKLVRTGNKVLSSVLGGTQDRLLTVLSTLGVARGLAFEGL